MCSIKITVLIMKHQLHASGGHPGIRLAEILSSNACSQVPTVVAPFQVLCCDMLLQRKVARLVCDTRQLLLQMINASKQPRLSTLCDGRFPSIFFSWHECVNLHVHVAHMHAGHVKKPYAVAVCASL
jgi:hypothetical protein